MDEYRRKFLKESSFFLTTLMYGCGVQGGQPIKHPVKHPDVPDTPVPVIHDYPYLYLPLNDGAGNSVSNQGSFNSNLSVFTDDEVQVWSKQGWFTTNSIQPSIVYTDDLQANSVLNIFNNVNDGVGGQTLLLSFWVDCQNIKGTLMSYGSTNNLSSGWQIMQSNNHLHIHFNDNGILLGPKLLVSSVFPVSGEHHIAILLDFKNGDFATWIDGVKAYPNITHREIFLHEANDPLATEDIGLTLFSRNIAITSGDRITQYPWSGSMKDFLAIDLSSSDNPWSRVEYVVYELAGLPVDSLHNCIGTI